MRMKISRRQIVTVMLVIMLLSLNYMMRYGVWKEMGRFNSEKTNYEKLALAYKFGGQSGIDYQLKLLAKHDHSSAGFIAKVSAELKDVKDIESFLRSAMKADRQKIKRLRATRAMISTAIFLVVALRMIFTSTCWVRDNKNEVAAFLQKITVKEKSL
jgi:hypothetical protein